MRIEEKTYTLAEARVELKRRECVAHGHAWDIISSAAGPFRAICGCGAAYRMERIT
jgi:hypothetical protein